MAVVLWQIEVSHYNEKARWALDHKGIAHERRAPLPGLHGFAALALTRGSQRRLPVIELDGRRIGDSTAIIAALEEYKPDPPLYPSDPGERERALELEDYFDEELAPRLRRFIWQHTLSDDDAVIEAIMPDGSPRRIRLMRRLAPLARPVVRRDYDVNAASAEEALAGIRAAMDRLESELGSGGYLVGGRFSVADLTAAALFTPVLCPPERPYCPATLTPPVQAVREELAARRGGEWVAEMYRLHRGQSAEVARR